MHFTIKNKDYKLNFGTKFVADLDKTHEMEREGIEFGMGMVIAQSKLELGSFETLADIIRCAITDRKFTNDDIYAALDEYNDLSKIFDEIEEELKNSQAVQVVEARMAAQEKETNRVQAAKKHTKK